MTPYVLMIDEFFPQYEFELMQAYAHTLEYGPVEAPFDHVVYPNIGLPVPWPALERIAREEMGLARPGEHIFKLPPKTSDSDLSRKSNDTTR